MAILNLKIHFILRFCHFYFSFLAKFHQLEKKGWNFLLAHSALCAALADQSSLRQQQQQISSPVSC